MKNDQFTDDCSGDLGPNWTPVPSRSFGQDALRFFRWNLQHYALALWGLRLRFDPPYPHVFKFFPQFLLEPVLEYRTYGAMVMFAGALAAWLPAPALTALVALWACVSFDRSKFLKSGFVFWRQVYKENGISHNRAHGRYMEQLILEIERRMKAGEPWEALSQEAFQLQDDVIRHARSEDAARRILAGM